MNFLIVGANFRNKGAQSMLFITVDELKKRVPDCNVYFATDEKYDEDLYVFKKFYYSDVSKLIALEPDSLITKTKKIKRWAKDVIKFVIGQRQDLFCYNDTTDQFGKINFVIDISGFNIGSKWSVNQQESFINNIRLAKKYNTPIALMPQSFGDFNYSKKQEHILPEIEKWFKYPKLIFAREKEGYNDLMEQFHLTNVKLSTDLVLQNTDVNINNIYKKLPKMKLPSVRKSSEKGISNLVAIIPNRQCFNHGDEKINIRLYKKIILNLLSRKKTIYLFRHSKEDLEVCYMIVQQFSKDTEIKNKNEGRTSYNNGSIILLDNDFSCFEYDVFIKNFDFIICSRFHGCVHAYRNSIPCILLGWATKYQELAENVGQKKYAFDITDKNVKIDKIVSTIDDMIENCVKESKIIKEHVYEIQKYNCFDQIEKWWH